MVSFLVSILLCKGNSSSSSNVASFIHYVISYFFLKSHNCCCSYAQHCTRCMYIQELVGRYEKQPARGGRFPMYYKQHHQLAVQVSITGPVFLYLGLSFAFFEAVRPVPKTRTPDIKEPRWLFLRRPIKAGLAVPLRYNSFRDRTHVFFFTLWFFSFSLIGCWVVMYLVDSFPLAIVVVEVLTGSCTIIGL